jgi:GNAT superfamily N-acetyltransferase
MNTLREVQQRIAGTIAAFEQGKGVQLVAEVDGVVVGTATLMRNPHPLFAHRAEIDSVVVHGGYQRQGIARRMVEEAGVRAASMGIEILEISCRAGEVPEKVYPRLGFIEYGRLPRGIVEPWGERRTFDQVFYYRPLERQSDG